MIVYRVSGEGLLRLAILAAGSPAADPAVLLGILRGADLEEPEPALPNIADGPDLGSDAVGEAPAVKPAKPE